MMKKKVATWYFAFFAVVNLFFAQEMRWISFRLDHMCGQLYGAWESPYLTLLLFRCDWWPWLFVAAGVAGCFASMFTKIKNQFLFHSLYCLIFVEGLIFYSILKSISLPLDW